MELNKRIIFITAGLIAAVIVSAAVYQFIFKQEEGELVSPGGQLTEIQKETSQLAIWEDPAGFSFQYPQNLQTDPHREDEKNYAHLEFSHPDHLGGIIVWMKDTTLKTIDNWAPEEDKTTRQGEIVITELGGHSARRATFTNGEVITAALDQEVIVEAEMFAGDLAFWQPIYDQMTASFEFIPLASGKPQTSSGTTSTTGGEIWLEEEVIE